MNAYATGADVAIGLAGYDVMDMAFNAAMFEIMPWLQFLI